MTIEERILNENYDLNCFFANAVHIDAHIKSFYEVECFMKMKLNDSDYELCTCNTYYECPYRHGGYDE